MSILAKSMRLKEGQKFFQISMQAYFICISMKLLSLHQFDVLIRRSICRGIRRFSKIFSYFSFPLRVQNSSQASERSIARLISYMLSQAKHIFRVIFVLFTVLSSNLANPSLTSGYNSFSFPYKSPTTTTFTLFLVTTSKILSFSYIQESCWN